MSLADHWDNESYLPVGHHKVKVLSHRCFEFNSGSPGVEFEVMDAKKRKMKLGICLKDTVIWKLAKFAKACGLSIEEARKYNPNTDACHKMLHGKYVMVVVEKLEKYCEVTDFYEVGGAAPPPAKESKPKEAPATGPSDDEIPF